MRNPPVKVKRFTALLTRLLIFNQSTPVISLIIAQI